MVRKLVKIRSTDLRVSIWEFPPSRPYSARHPIFRLQEYPLYREISIFIGSDSSGPQNLSFVGFAACAPFSVLGPCSVDCTGTQKFQSFDLIFRRSSISSLRFLCIQACKTEISSLFEAFIILPRRIPFMNLHSLFCALGFCRRYPGSAPIARRSTTPMDSSVLPPIS
jgi:hypothetical protein